MKKIEVVAAVFKNEKKEFFCARRKKRKDSVLKWEFPEGGKEGETKIEALKREIKEELDVVINVKYFITTISHQYESFHLKLNVYYAEITEGNLILSDHIDYKWSPKEKLKDLDWSSADIPIIDKLSN